jgi:hypothetical protein
MGMGSVVVRLSRNLGISYSFILSFCSYRCCNCPSYITCLVCVFVSEFLSSQAPHSSAASQMTTLQRH